MKKKTGHFAGMRAAGFVLLMLVWAILSGSACAENSIQVSVPERQYMENGIVLTLSNVPENDDFAVSVRTPRYVTESLGERIEHWNFEIRIARENGVFSFSHESERPSSAADNPPHAVSVSSTAGENGTLLIHIELEEDNIGITGTEWPMETVVWEQEYRSYREGSSAGSFVLLRYPEGVTVPDPQELTGGWKVLSSSDGQAYDDFWFGQDEIIFRRHDGNGDPYYAPRRIVKSVAPFYRGDHFTWRILNENGTYVITDENGLKLSCMKTDENAGDFTLASMSAATPAYASLFGHDWHFWDSDLQFVSDAYWRFYEDVVIRESGDKTTAMDIRYEDSHRMRFMDGGNDGTLYEWETYGLGGWVSLYTYEIRDGVQLSRHENRTYIEDGSLLAPAPTPEPTPDTANVPEPVSITAEAFTSEKIDRGYNTQNYIPTTVGKEDTVESGMANAFDVSDRLNRICEYLFPKFHSLAFVENHEFYPVRYRFYALNVIAKPSMIFHFSNTEGQEIKTVGLGDEVKAVYVVYSGAVMPGERLYFNIMIGFQPDNFRPYRIMICRDAYDDSMAGQAYTQELAAGADATPTPAPTPQRGLTISGKAPLSSFANYSEEELPWFSLTLNRDGTATLQENFMEESAVYHVTWSWDGSTLISGDSVNGQIRTEFHNGKGVYNFYNSPVEVTLPDNAAAFFLEALGYVPDGVPSGGSVPGAVPSAAVVTPTPTPAGDSSPDEETPVPDETVTPRPSVREYDQAQLDVYYQYIAEGTYLHDGNAEYNTGADPYEKPSFAFCDLDGDGSLEMIGFNGYSSHADAVCYAYRCEGESVVFLGTAGGDPGCFYYYIQDQYPGLIFSDGGMGYLYYDYITMQNGVLIREKVHERQDADGNRKVTQITADDELFRLVASGGRKKHRLVFYTADDVQKLGREGFLTEVIRSVSDLSEEEDGNPGPAWEEPDPEGNDPTAAPENPDTENTEPDSAPEQDGTEDADPTTAPESAHTEIPGTNGLKQAPVQSVTATTYIGENKGDDTYAPARMIDGLEETCFQFRTSVTKLGKEYIWFTFTEPTAIDELWIKNGFWKYTDGHDQYTRNSRVKTMVVDYLYEGQTEYSDAKKIKLKDDKKRKDWIRIDLGHKDNVVAVRLLIKEMYRGSRYKTDVCISEVMFVHK